MTFEADVQDLPDGTFIQINNAPYLIANNHLLLWTPGGYEKPGLPLGPGRVMVLTPQSTVNTFRAGYLPQMDI